MLQIVLIVKLGTEKCLHRALDLGVEATRAKRFPLVKFKNERNKSGSQPIRHTIPAMTLRQYLLHTLCSALFFVSFVQGLKFDLDAYHQGSAKAVRCIRNFVAKETLVVVTATVDGHKGDGMIVNMHVRVESVECHWYGD